MQKLVTVLILYILFINACGTSYQPTQVKPADDNNSNSGKDEITKSEPVPADSLLETVTWNLEWYGSGFHGPDDFDQQTNNIVQIMDSLRADLYAFEEVYQQKSLNNILLRLTHYKGFVADYIRQSQKMAFVYNTNTIDSVSAGAIDDVDSQYQGDWNYDWAGGRLPMYFEFNYTYENTSLKIYAIVIHGKANTGDNQQEYQEAYQRRKKAAMGLHDYLQQQHPDAKIILLGDYNDDVDVSIYDNSSASPYQTFVSDADHYRVISKILSDDGQNSTVRYSDIIDHITVSNELYPFYVDGSVSVFTDPENFISNYGNTTSDHYPVWAKFDVTQ